MRYILALLLFAAPVAAQYRSCGTYQATGYQQTYAAPAIVTPFVQTIAYTAYVPTYVAGYIAAPSAVVQAAPAHAPVCDTSALKAEIAEMRTLIRQLSTPQLTPTYAPPVMPQAAPKQSSAAGIFNQRCASCHDKGIAAAKGGNIPLTDQGNLLQLPLRTATRCVTAAHRGFMPKGGPPISDVEMSVLVQWLDSVTQGE